MIPTSPCLDYANRDPWFCFAESRNELAAWVLTTDITMTASTADMVTSTWQCKPIVRIDMNDACQVTFENRAFAPAPVQKCYSACTFGVMSL